MKVRLACAALLIGTVSFAEAAGPHMMQPRVPEGQLEEARGLANPLTSSPEVVAQGKALYEGKGTCTSCHGVSGDGRGPGAATLNPPPRNFQHHGFWNHRSDGEIFWVIKHGSPGTAMIPFGGMLSDHEIWTIIQYEQTFSHRSGRMNRQDHQERRGGMKHQRGSESQQGGPEPCCGDR